METRESFERFADALGGRRRRAQAMARSLESMAASDAGWTPIAGGGGAADKAARPGRGRVVFADAAALAQETIEDLSAAECELWQQNEALFQAQTQLDERSRHYQKLFEMAPAAYVVTTGPGVILELNQSASALFDRPRNFAVGKPLALFVEAGAERTAFRTALNRLVVSEDAQTWPVRLSPRGRCRVDVTAAVRAVREPSTASTTLYWLLSDDGQRADEDLL